MFVPQIKQTFISRLDCSMGLVESMAGCLAVQRLLSGWLRGIAQPEMITFGKWANVPLHRSLCNVFR